MIAYLQHLIQLIEYLGRTSSRYGSRYGGLFREGGREETKVRGQSKESLFVVHVVLARSIPQHRPPLHLPPGPTHRIHAAIGPLADLP